MDIRVLRNKLGDTQSEFAARYNIPFRTIQNWETGIRKPPQYVVDLLADRVQCDLANRKTANLPKYDPKKIDLPHRNEYTGALEWLTAIQDFVDDDIVFALDEALMMQGGFLGRDNEFLVWVYGNDRLARYNGIVVLGNQISSYNVCEKNGIRYTNFDRTVADSLANEPILDMQGITEALSDYYYTHNESFEGITVIPQYQEQFEDLAEAAIEYYES